MFTSSEITYIEMPKTGSMHIVSLLSQLFEGERIGVHNAATSKQFKLSKYFISSIRNPWKWYVSFWAYGAQGSGVLFQRHTMRKVKEPARVMVKTKSVTKTFRSAIYELTKDVDLWRSVYDRTNEIESFRRWLQLVHDPKYGKSMGDGYGDSTLPDQVGYMTYRYLTLCCRNVNQLHEPGNIKNLDDLVRFENQNCYIDYFIRQESMADTFYEAVQQVRPLTDEEMNLIYMSNKRNPSKQRYSLGEYYDEELIELVRSRDRLLIDKFQYKPPL